MIKDNLSSVGKKVNLLLHSNFLKFNFKMYTTYMSGCFNELTKTKNCQVAKISKIYNNDRQTYLVHVEKAFIGCETNLTVI